MLLSSQGCFGEDSQGVLKREQGYEKQFIYMSGSVIAIWELEGPGLVGTWTGGDPWG